MSDTAPMPVGIFTRDLAGLYHFRAIRPGGVVSEFAEYALAHRPAGPAWFWFNGTPAPIHPDDNTESLAQRWDEWRAEYQSNPDKLLSRLNNLDEAAIAEAVTQVSQYFRTFGGGMVKAVNNPLSIDLKNGPLEFAGGVKVEEVVRLIFANR